MSEALIELTKRLEEARKDTAWVQRLRAAATRAEYDRLLSEKGIEAPTELRAAFAAGQSTGALADDDLDGVTGGFGPLFRCPQAYDFFLCQFVSCPHLHRDEYTPDDKQYTYSCSLFQWKEVFYY